MIRTTSMIMAMTTAMTTSTITTIHTFMAAPIIIRIGPTPTTP
jgi:hypothetical protein